MSNSISNVDLQTLPVGRLGIIPLKGCEEVCKRIDDYITAWRKDRDAVTPNIA